MGTFRRRTARFFGNDIFISYSRRDGVRYVDALAAALSERGYAVIIDRFDTEASPTVPERLLRQLEAASMLVVVGSIGAASSEAVRTEIVRFRTTGRNLVPIDIDGAVTGAIWVDAVTGLPLERDTEAALATGTPDEAVIRRIVNAFDYATRSQRMRRTFWATFVLTIAVALAAVWLTADAQRRRQSAERRAQTAAAAERAARERAEEEGRRAEEARTMSAQARQDAEQQQKIASALRIANAATAAWQRGTASNDTVLLLAAESMRRHPTQEAVTLLDEALSRHVRQVAHFQYERFVHDLVASPDGRYVVVWRTTTGSPLLIDATRHKRIALPAPVRCGVGTEVSFSEGSAWMGVVSPGERLGEEKLWLVDLRRRPVRARSVSGSAGRHGITFGRQVYIVHASRTTRPLGPVEVRRIEDDTLLWSRPATAVAASGSRVALQTSDREVSVVHEESGEALTPPLTLPALVRSIVFSADGSRMIVHAQDDASLGVARVYDSTSFPLRQLAELPVPPSTRSVIVSDDGSAVVTAQEPGWLGRRDHAAFTLWSGSSYEPRWTVTTPDDPRPAFTRDGAELAFIDGGRIRVVDVTRGGTIPVERARITAESPIRQLAAVGGELVGARNDGLVAFWSHTSAKIPAFSAESFVVDAMSRSVVAHSGRAIVQYDLERGERVFERPLVNHDGIPSREEMAWSVAVSGRTVAIAFPSRLELRIGGRTVVRMDEVEPTTMDATISADERIVVTAGVLGREDTRGRLRIRDARTGNVRERATFARPITDVACSKDASLVAALDADGTLWLRAGENGRFIRTVTTGEPGFEPHLAVSSDGSRIAVAHHDGKIIELQRASSRVTTWDVGASVHELSYSADGRFLLIVSGTSNDEWRERSQLSVHDTRTGTTRSRYALSYAVRAAAFSGHSEDVVLFDHIGVMHAIFLDAASAIRRVCRTVGHGIAPEEWTAYLGDEPHVDPCRSGR